MVKLAGAAKPAGLRMQGRVQATRQACQGSSSSSYLHRCPERCRHRRPAVSRPGLRLRAAAEEEEVLRGLDSKYGPLSQGRPAGLAPRAPAKGPARAPGRPASGAADGSILLILLNLAVFAAGHFLHAPWVQALSLDHAHPRWWQWLTSAFCHADWAHLSSNIFLLLIFGKSVEEEEGPVGVWTTYIVTALGANIATHLLTPNKAFFSLGASGAVFGMFAVATLLKVKPSLPKLVEAGILGQFVLQQLRQEVGNQASAWGGRGAVTTVGGYQVGHLAHLGGALVGVVLIVLLSRLPQLED